MAKRMGKMSISFEKEWFSTTETAEILGVSYTSVINFLNNRNSLLCIINKSEYKKEKGKYLLHRDYINRCQRKEWFTVSEVSELLKKSESWVYYQFYNGKIPKNAYNTENKLLIHTSYINEQKRYFNGLDEKYFTYEESSRILG
ncbi:hypothetical protein, partial [Mesobacillus zeae]|uniref:hypothetical protein n=1 Tax=Mesobacillus zeae TaxID=1917180 RepID=UPI00300BA3E0